MARGQRVAYRAGGFLGRFEDVGATPLDSSALPSFERMNALVVSRVTPWKYFSLMSWTASR
jgi:hypothetical protein